MNTTYKSWVLITGASSGLGEEFARQYAEKGHRLILVARRLDRLQSLAEALQRQFHTEVVVEQVDLSVVAAVTQLDQRLSERGIAVDILINNAGHGLQGAFVDASLDAALAMVQLDVASLTAVTHVFAQGMRTRRRGKILLVASTLGYLGVQHFAVYSAAKAYVIRLGEAIETRAAWADTGCHASPRVSRPAWMDLRVKALGTEFTALGCEMNWAHGDANERPLSGRSVLTQGDRKCRTPRRPQ